MSSENESNPEPPETDRRPVTDEIHGSEVVDPYRWLESGTEEVRRWEANENEYADTVLATPQRDVLRDRYATIARVTDYAGVKPAGDRLFQEVKHPDDEQPVLYVYDSLEELRSENGRELIDPTELDESGTTSVDWYVPDSSGSRVALGVAEGGDEQYDIHLLDVASGETVEVLRDTGRTNESGFAWMDQGCYYVTTGGMDDEDTDQLDKALRYHHLGTASESDPTLMDDFEPQEWPGVETDDGVVVIRVMDGWAETDVYIARGDPTEATPTPLVVGEEAHFEPTLDAGTVYFTTDYDAPRSRVLACPVDRALDASRNESLEVSSFREVVPESDRVLRSITPAGEYLLVHYHRDAVSELTVFTDDGGATAVTEVDLPSFVTVEAIRGANDRPDVYFTMESFSDPTSSYHLSLPDGEMSLLSSPDLSPDFDISVSQAWFTSADGTDVPAFLVRRSDLGLTDGPHPTVLTGYGGFRVNRTPTFDRFRLPFLEAGGVFVLATLRGGTEYGTNWHEAGRRENKHHVFEDAEAVVDGVINRGVTDPERLAIAGGSNGGLLVGALMTRRPDRYCAVLCQVPLLDMIRFHRFLLGAAWTTEYGHPEDEDAFEYLRAYSPYHNVEEAAYPAVLFTTARGDARVHPSHARKMTPLVRDNTTSGRPVVLRIREETGHGVGKPTSMLIDEQAETWGFLTARLGISAAELGSNDD